MTGRAVLALVAFVFLLVPEAGWARQAPPRQSQARRLVDALQELQRRGLNIIFSSQVVPPGLHVQAEPRSGSLRRMLDALLTPHGLIAKDGPGGTVLIVKDPRARVTRTPAPVQQPDQRPAGAADPDDTRAPPRFVEIVDVAGIDPTGTVAGPSPRTVSPIDARTHAGGFENVFRTLQSLPGVTATDELGSRIAVRGGSPDQNLTVMDGVEIHNPFRLVVPVEDLTMVGLASAFNPDTVERFEFVPGAFDVRHGDRLSSLLEVTSRDGSEAEAVQGSSFVGVVDSNVIIEGRLPGHARGSWLVSARRSHLNLVAEKMIGTALPSFQDLQARLSWRPSPQQHVSLFGVASRERTRPGNDGADAGHTTRAANDMLGVTLESTLRFGGLSKTTASLSRLADRLGAFENSFDNSRGANSIASVATGGLLQFELSRRIDVRDLAVRQEVALRPTAGHWFDMGVEAHALATRWAWRIAGDRSPQQPNGSSSRLGASLPDAFDSSLDSLRLGAWVQDRWTISPRLALQPGLRVDRSSVTGRVTVAPRVSGALQLARTFRVDAALAVHTQSPGYEKVLQSDYFLDLSQEPTSSLRSERALHSVVGVHGRTPWGLTARVDAYYKRFSDLIVGRLETEVERRARLAGYDVPPELATAVPDRPRITTMPTNDGVGRAYGVEGSVAKTDAGSAVNGWVAYSFGRASRRAYGVTTPFDFDRRHAVSAVASVAITPRLDLTVTGRWATGLPRTPVRGVQLALAQDVGDLDGDGNRVEWRPRGDVRGDPMFQPDFGELSNINSARLPHFARVDMRATYRPSWSGDRWAFYADVINVLNGKNLTQIDSALVFNPRTNRPDIVERPQDRGIPPFPSFGVRFWF